MENNEIDRDKLIERVKKLLANAGNNPNENEALVAAQKAAILIAKHNIDAFDLKGKSDSGVVLEQVTSNEIRQSWARYVWNSVSGLNFCMYYYTSRPNCPDVHNIIGTRANTISTKVMALYLIGAIERLSYEAPIKGRERQAFMLGAAVRISTRLNELKVLRATGATKEQTDPTGTTLPALANIYDRHEEANKAHYKDILGGGKLGKGKHTTTKHGGAYLKGMEAANGISLNDQVDKSDIRVIK